MLKLAVIPLQIEDDLFNSRHFGKSSPSLLHISVGMPIGYHALLLLLLGLDEGIHAFVASHEPVCGHISLPRKQPVGVDGIHQLKCSVTHYLMLLIDIPLFLGAHF